MVVLFWVDDCIFYANNYKDIKDTLKILKDEFLFEKRRYGRVFGVQIEGDKKDGKITLIQTELIEKILLATNLEDPNLKFTPADKIPPTATLKEKTAAKLGTIAPSLEYCYI